MTADDGLRLAFGNTSPIDSGQTISTPAFSAAMAAATTVDITGIPRPLGAAYDMGAYEGGGDRQNTVYVDSANVSGTHTGTSWSTAFNKLEDAFALPNPGATIWVAKGTYQPPLYQSYRMNMANRLYGGFSNTDTVMEQRNWKTNKTILKGNGSRVINNDYNTVLVTGDIVGAAVLDGFIVTGGIDTTVGGAGMYNNLLSPAINNVVFIDNHTTGDGGGLYAINGTVNVRNSEFINNSAAISGGAVYNHASSPVYDHIVFRNNTANKGGAISGESGTQYAVINCVFEQNNAVTGGAIANYQSTPSVTNSVFRENTATNYAVFYDQTGTSYYTNVTFSKNTATNGELFFVSFHPKANLLNCVFRGNSPITSNTTNVANLRYCAAETLIPGTANVVVPNNPFVNDTQPAGADGIWMTADDGLALKHGALNSAINGGKTVLATDGNSGIAEIVTKDLTGLARPSGDAYDIGAYEYKYPVINHYYVDSASVGTGLHDGTSWAAAYNHPDRILNSPRLAAGDTIWVAKGTYQPLPDSAFSMVKGVAMYGGFRNTDSALSQRNLIANHSVLKGNGAGVINNKFPNISPMTNSAVLDGFTISAGGSSNGGGIYLENASPTLRNLIVKNNRALGSGGGIFMVSSSPTLDHILIDSNFSGGGGGGIAINNAAPVLKNIVFSNNASLNNGGGLENYGETSITNAVFYRNTATYGGGGVYSIYESGPPRFSNTVFYENASDMGGGVYAEGSNCAFLNATFCRNVAGLGGGSYFSFSDPEITNSIYWGNRDSTGTSGNPDITADNVWLSHNFTQQDYSAFDPDNIVGTTSPFVNEVLPMGPDRAWLTEDDGMQLQYCTPTVNKGDNGAAATLIEDILGHARIKNATVDMGAYEKQNNTTTGQFANNVKLSNSLANTLPFAPVCDDAGWTYYADPSTPDSLGFAINWGTGNGAAKANAAIYLQVDTANTKVANIASGVFTMRRYWNVDLHVTTLVNPVQVRFYYDPADTIALYNNAVTAGFIGHTGAVQWFKTVGALFNPSQVSAMNINNGNRVLMQPFYGSDNGIAYAQFSSITSFSGGTAALTGGASVPLPVKLLSFTAKKNADNKSVFCNWQVASEDLDYYEVQRSTDAVTFETAGRIEASGKAAYSFNDNPPVEMIVQYPVLYYRLQMVDKSGNYTISRTEKVNFTRMEGMTTISPNPANNEVRVRNTNTALNGRDVWITDARGSLVQHFKMAGEVTLDISKWQPGIYFLKLPDGNVLKLIKA